LREHGVEHLLGISSDGHVEKIASVDQDQSRHEFWILCRQRGSDEGTHRVAHDNTGAHVERLHGSGDIAGVLGQAVWTIGLVGIASPSQVEGKQRTSSREPLGNTDEVYVRSCQTVKRDNGDATPRPVTEVEFNAISRDAASRLSRHLQSDLLPRGT